jgi:RNA polymerase sigma-70 factor (ECF subfamily)
MQSDSDFVALTEPYRRELLAHCYRILGSIHDAEDLVQDTNLRAWRGFDGFEGRSSIRRWLYKIATMACLTVLESRTRRPLPSGLGAPSDDHRATVAPAEPSVPWLQPLPDALVDGGDPSGIVADRIGVRLAFIAALQHLPARQRAVLTLRDVLAFRATEVAEMLGTTPAAVDSALRRARARMAEARPVQEDLTDRAGGGASRSLLDAYTDAFTRADLSALVTLLRLDVELEMPPIPTWFAGRSAVVGFLRAKVLHPDRWRMLPTRANGQPAAAEYERTPAGVYEPRGIQVLTLAGARIARITAFHDATLVPTFGLPPALDS